MINPLVSAVFTAALFSGAQQSTVGAVVPGSPILMQISGLSFADPQVKAADSKVKVNPTDPKADDLFAGTEKFAQGASEATELNLDPDTMGIVGSHSKDGDLAKKMKFMVIRSYTYDKPGMYKMEDVETYRKKLGDGTWKCSVRVREKNESTDICSRLGPDHETREMVILTAAPKELTFIHMGGQMSLDQMGHEAGNLQRR